MTVITISRQLGSLGYEVAEAVAHQTGYRFVCREVIDDAARRAGAPEAALATVDELGLLQVLPSPKESRAYRAAAEATIREFARRDAVIVGRAAQVILRDHPSTLHVRVIAPLALRAQRIAAQRHVSRRAALAQIKASDEFRREFIERFYRVDWSDPELYDLIVNTARVSVERAADIIRIVASSR